MIVESIQAIVPGWNPPVSNGRTWVKCLCPFHSESVPSASISFEHDAFNCFACGVKGDWRSLLRKQHGLSRADVEGFAEGIFMGSGEPLPAKSAKKSGRRVFAE